MSNSTLPTSLPAYAFAPVVGFEISYIRVRVTRIDERSNNAWCFTADLVDAGTPLTLDLDKLEWENETAEVMIHRYGLLAFI